MYSQGSYDAQSRQGPQTPRPPPYLQHLPALPPPLPLNFQHGPLLPLTQVPPRPGQPGMHIYQHGPLAPHLTVRQAPPRGMPSPGQPYLHPPPAIHGSAPLPNIYVTAQQNPQHSYIAPGPPPGSHAQLPPRNLPPPPSHGQTLYKTPIHQSPQLPPLVQGLQQIPPPPPHPPTSNFSTSALSVSTSEATVGNSQMSSVAPSLPQPPVPPSTSPVSSPASMSFPLPSGSNLACQSDLHSSTQSGNKSGTSYNEVNSLNKDEHNIPAHNFSTDLSSRFLEGGSCSGVDNLGGDALTSKRIVVPDVPHPPPKPAEAHSPADSDMEMEDDITMSYNDHSVNQPTERLIQATDPVSSELDAKKQLHALSSSSRSEAATLVLSDNDFLFSGSTKLGEQGSKFNSSCDDLRFGSSVSRVKSPVNNPTGASEYMLSSERVNSSTPSANSKSSSSSAAAAECINSDKYPGQEIKGSSPFRLLQDYDSNDSSENDNDPCLKDANRETVSTLLAVGEYLHADTGSNLKIDTGSRSPYKTEREFGQVSEFGKLYRPSDFASDSQGEFKDNVPTSTSSGLTAELVNTKCENPQSIALGGSLEALPKEDASEGRWAKVASRSKDEKENEDKSTSNAPKIDKFGRLFKEGASDSDSDDSHLARRRNKRGRSRSRSRSLSPPYRRRRRSRSRRSRSRPRRRREKRSRSRSWSPRNRRSRSRSPSFRHAGEINNGITGRGKGQIPECFDFLRGRCYRGASCRYMHHDSEKNDGSRNHRSKQRSEQLHPSSKNRKDEFSLKVSDHEQKMGGNYDISASGSRATKDDTIFHNREDPIIIKSDNFRVVATKVPETKIVKEKSANGTTVVDRNFQEVMESDQPIVVDSFPSKPSTVANILKSTGETCKNLFPSLEDSVIQQPQSFISDPVLQDVDHPVLHTDDSSISDSSPDKISRTSPKELHASETLPNSADSLHNPSQMPPFPLSAPTAEGNNASHTTQLSRDYNLIPKTAEFHSQSAPLESFPSYMLPNQNSLFPVPPYSSSVSLPPPPPLLPPHGPTINVGTTQPGVTLQFQQSCMPPKGEFGSQMFSRPYSVELSGNPQVGDFQHRAYPPVQEPQQAPLQVEDFRLKALPGCNLSGQQFGGTTTFGEERLKQLPMHPLGVSGSITRSNNYPLPMSFPQEASATKMQSFSGDPGEIGKSTSQIRPYSQQEWPPHGLHHAVPDSVYGLPGKITSSRYPPDIQDRNQQSHLPEFGVPKSTHFNPYASTFEKPLSSRFSSDVFRQEKDTTPGSKHDHPLSLSNASVDGGAGSRLSTSPTPARGLSKLNPRSGGDQYDPLFDSIEPSSNAYRKSDCIQKWEPSGESDIKLLKSSNQLLDVEENNKKKDAGGFALATSLDNEEFGETADEEVGDIENGSQSNPNDLTNTNTGEMEIDQIKSPEKSKKSKESRSMKLFKACLADFVKEVLKPSWRQGNMSKETFKTVVKKTVDKVSGAMKSHQMPKSKAKINQYIDSSQRKLMKLVMGYVDKYAKG
ncbi:hypothetical protein JCGZ_11741 [Jatropha curcas]|uniref:C3H1-type domain-containing protein n=1 Tax=Jatropha curcas TaxID=180498 RepID=A0A067KGH7_JATCU|nr:serine/arginine repetitive matrix protein 2 [Jatropha curcas]XP_037493002.1 serine/arginine repetitive matrix protein 2 [Jatropha curcas]KDP31365.1 hypothetical protein JCGZ_11741 [Jatropha curcas]